MNEPSRDVNESEQAQLLNLAYALKEELGEGTFQVCTSGSPYVRTMFGVVRNALDIMTTDHSSLDVNGVARASQHGEVWGLVSAVRFDTLVLVTHPILCQSFPSFVAGRIETTAKGIFTGIVPVWRGVVVDVASGTSHLMPMYEKNLC